MIFRCLEAPISLPIMDLPEFGERRIAGMVVNVVTSAAGSVEGEHDDRITKAHAFASEIAAIKVVRCECRRHDCM
jgi:hypothetical protein